MVELYPLSRRDIDKGNFPLTHDCVLKVRYIYGCPIRYAYFTTRSIDTASLYDVISKLPMVKAVEVSPVDLLSDTF